jgi:LysR family cyn operon transcriptional activator
MLPLENTDLHSQDLFSDEVLLVVSKDHPLAKKKKLEAKDLHLLEIAMASVRITTARLVRNYFDELAVRPTAVVEFDDGNALVEIARIGRLAAILPTGAFVRDPNMICFALPGRGLSYTVAAIWSRLSPAAKVFLTVATEESKKERALAAVSRVIPRS